MHTISGGRNTSITDVAHFFHDLTNGYVEFTHSSNELKLQLDSLTPTAIHRECEKLTSQRNELNQLDDQLIAILELTGADSTLKEMIDDYSLALMKARIACDKLYHKLAAIKGLLLEQHAADDLVEV